MKSRSVLMLYAVLFLSTGAVHATGFMIYEHGASATGMADARTALADDVNALFFNPAAITELKGLRLQLGATGILPYLHYQAAGLPDPPRVYLTHGLEEKVVEEDGLHDADAKVKLFTPFHLYASYLIPDTGVAMGLSVNNPYGLGTYWPGDWDGRFIFTESDMETYVINPVVALDVAALLGFKQSFKLSVAAGYNLVYGTARLSRRIDLRATEFLYPDVDDPWGEMRMTGSGVGHGWNLAVYAELPGQVSLGASMRGGFGEVGATTMPFSGTAQFWFNPAGELVRDRLLLKVPDKTKGSLDLNLPMNMNFVVAYLGVERLKVALDFYYAFFESYKELDLKFDCLDDPEAPCTDLAQDPLLADWNNSWQVSVGAEYLLTDALAVRAGWGLVSSPVPAHTYDPSLPDGWRNLICAGFGYLGDWWKLDVGYMLAFWEGEKDNDVGDYDNPEEAGIIAKGNPNGKANGTYSSVVHLLAVSFSVSLF